jgi:hypothetical protein
MVRNRVELALVVAGLVLALLQVDVTRATERLRTPVPLPTAAAPAPQSAAEVPVIWREFRPGVRQPAPSTTSVSVCAAALERGAGKSALVLRFCDAQPITPQRRFAFGYEDFVVRAHLPGGATLAYDLLEYEPTRDGGTNFAQGPLRENDVPIANVGVRNVTDIVFVLSRELPVGLPTIEISGRFFGTDVHEIDAFAPLGADLVRTESERADLAPDWARAPY